ncbi:hypothetical protein MGYG_04882 [Nannizzia gypsea CBS 118893]|uniref:Sulfotransferase n=1 Tax=Arthroderma gypseum (strain ATCC MYA-4604 / CBS 118893) TaxID=535722 RepID=E4UXD4_ARTGP|nr:hypothetical protein MGYG_04882 [Nannizzia gypsea CBS 118893]EFR01882.1 hypothetical protein MGYG_04882 [Nannizzia gypsea CBS 118893]
MKSHNPRRFYLITYPRTGSNLLVRMLGLENQPDFVSGDDRGGYIFLPTIKLMTDLGLRSKGIADWTQDEIQQVQQSYQDCFDEFQEYLEVASSERRSVVIKEHVHFLVEPTALSELVFGTNNTPQDIPWTMQIPESYGLEPKRSLLNQTVMPDEFLKTWSPAFLIRHPALAFPSLYRALCELETPANDEEADSLGEHCMTLRWTRALYDWYSRNLTATESYIDGRTTWPIVLDADDIMTDPDVVVRFAEIMGMDVSQLSFSWTPASMKQKKQMDPFTKRYLSTLLSSGGIVQGKIAGSIDIESEAKKWCLEFGYRAGKRIERLVREAMPDYKFLKSRRLTPRPAAQEPLQVVELF